MCLFSILISLYHKENPLFLRQSLKSIFTQTLSPTEVVLVEDGPLTDELHEVVKKIKNQHPELKVVPLPTNQGLGKALNEGLKHCSYDLVARMDTDDIAKPDRFEKQLAIFRKHPEVDVVESMEDGIRNRKLMIFSTIPTAAAASRPRRLAMMVMMIKAI